MRTMVPLWVAVTALSLWWPMAARAAQPPQITRAVGTPQAVGVLHTLRVIPEACTRIQGRFTGNAAAPYDFDVVRTNARCQPRAQLVDAAKVSPEGTPGWRYVDLVRVPSASCPSQQAVVRLWGRDATTAVPPRLDAQGRSRVYLKDALGSAAADAGKLPVYAVEMDVAGRGCH